MIKARSAETVVRALGRDPRTVQQDVAARGPSEAELALAEATREIERLQGVVADLRARAPEAERAAREAGRHQGLEEAEDQADRLVAAVCTGVDQARAAWEDRLAELDALAAMLAQASLRKLFGEAPDLGDLVTRAIRLRTQALGRESVVSIRVSGADFADDAARDALRSAVAAGSSDIVVDPALTAGECRLDLKLGSIDVGIASQWRELDRFFDLLIAGEVAA
ncbi:FliH/SctL family protein [Sphingomonas oligophenolica]|uniref:FliH/SctL family protein n=1 Tax=Sphingomonas oligophenolica TaxID=301154 RepID=A0ABU9Y426_9SPHN